MYSLFWYFLFVNFFILLTNLLFFLIRFNLILILIFVEVIIFYVNLNFIIISILFNDLIGQIFAMFILSLAGIDVSIGLIFLIIYYKYNDILYINKMALLKA